MNQFSSGVAVRQSHLPGLLHPNFYFNQQESFMNRALQLQNSLGVPQQHWIHQNTDYFNYLPSIGNGASPHHWCPFDHQLLPAYGTHYADPNSQVLPSVPRHFHQTVHNPSLPVVIEISDETEVKGIFSPPKVITTQSSTMPLATVGPHKVYSKARGVGIESMKVTTEAGRVILVPVAGIADVLAQLPIPCPTIYDLGLPDGGPLLPAKFSIGVAERPVVTADGIVALPIRFGTKHAFIRIDDVKGFLDGLS